jgi:sugar lactone lactonase YvrE
MCKRVYTQPTTGKCGKKKPAYNKWSLLLLTSSLATMLVVSSSMSIHASEQYKYVLKWGSFGSGNSQFMRPHDIAFDSKGNVYVSGRDNNNIQKFTHNGTFLLKWGTKGSADGQFSIPYSIGIDPSDHVFVVDRENSRIQEFDINGTFINKWYGVSANDKFKRPEDITFSPFGIFITDTGNNRVLKVDNKFNLIKQWGTKGTGSGQFIHPHAIDVDSKGNVYVGVLNQPGVQVFDSNGTYLTRWSSSGTGPGQFSIPQEHVAVDKNDYIYIVDGASNPRVQKFFTNGTLVAIIGTKGSGDGQLLKPEHVSIDEKGNLYVVDRGNARIQVFEPIS